MRYVLVIIGGLLLTFGLLLVIADNGSMANMANMMCGSGLVITLIGAILATRSGNKTSE